MLTKKYKFESAYVNENGIQGSSFEMFVSFKNDTSKDILNKIDNFVDGFDHAIMFSKEHKNVDFLNNTSKRVIEISNVIDEEVTPYFYVYLTLFGVNTEERENIVSLSVDDTKDTIYTITPQDIKNIKEFNFFPEFIIK